MGNAVHDQFLSEITTAWSDVPRPQRHNIFISDSYDDEGITDYFSDTSWQGHAVADLRAHCSSISLFFTPEAYHYWLPAYLLAAVVNPEELSQGIESLITSLTPGSRDHKKKMALLTNNQLHAVIHVIEHIALINDCPNQSCCAGAEKLVLRYLYELCA